jgi:REP element-mobilizing transposase RayT
MPRQPRLDISGLLHHVIVRGIERGIIFCDDTDRRDFLDRFSSLLTETGTECLAWALIPNHFHLLLRPGETSLSSFMRRLLTGYAVTYNRRHERSGHLFQNRYKSIVCEEDVYLLELIRYIHLNPLRAKLVPDIEKLDSYLWCGHAELMGRRPGTGLVQDTVLALFGEKLGNARRAYRQFIEDGIGKHSELSGGGLRRSQELSPATDKFQDSDERVLGSGDFIKSLRQEGFLEPDKTTKMTLSELQKVIEGHYKLASQELFNRGRKNSVAEARNLFCYCGVQILRNSGAEVGCYLGVGPSSVTRSVRKGKQLLGAGADVKVKEFIEQMLKQ